MVIQVGLIGLSASDEAWASQTHALPLQKEPLSSKFKLNAIATSSAESAAVSAKRWGIPPEKAYSSAEDIAKDPDVDLVVVSVKLPKHRDLALPALNAGKDVFVEWPLATNLEQVAELQAAAKRGGGRTFMGLQARTSPTILKAKEIIDSGALGRVVSSIIVGLDNYLLYLPPRFDYEHDAKNRADISTITSGHVLDAQSFLLGEYKHITSTNNCFFPEITTPLHSTTISRNAPDSFLVQGVLQSGAVASLSFICTPPENPSSIVWTIAGEKGTLKIEGPNINIQIVPPKLSWYHDGSWEDVSVPDPLAFGQVGNLYLAIAGENAVPGSLVDFDGAAIRHRMLEACAKSARDGTRETYM